MDCKDTLFGGFFSVFFLCSFFSQKIDCDFLEGFGPDFCLFVLVNLLLQ